MTVHPFARAIPIFLAVFISVGFLSVSAADQTPEGIHLATPVEGAAPAVKAEAAAAQIPASVTTAPIVGSAVILGGSVPDAKDGMFTFSVTRSGKNPPSAYSIPMPENVSSDACGTVVSTADGKIDLGRITFTEPGRYIYTIKESSSCLTGITTDSCFWEMTVAVFRTADSSGLEAEIHFDRFSRNGEETASPVCPEGFSFVFENRYRRNMDLSIMHLTDSEGAAPVRFLLTLSDGGTPLSDSFALRILTPGTAEKSSTISFDADGHAELLLSAGQQAVLCGLPVGVNYSIQSDPESNREISYSLNGTLLKGPDGKPLSRIASSVSSPCGSGNPNQILAYTGHAPAAG